ncbi:MAG TPA: ATP-grasp domain-containing protein, partial [Gemmatimonadaceae bacterium]
KPRASGGGHGISAWQPGDALPRTHILQERIAGTPGSIAFVAHDGNALPFAISRQLVGDAAFGATAFQYCGSILSDRPRALIDAATECAQLLTEELTLVGLACLDFVARDGVPHAIELNPRYSSSMELAERAFDFSVFEAHARACRRLSASTTATAALATTLRSAGAFGKAILFAPHDLTMGDTRPWLADPDVRDVPHPGETIPRGHPVCTIFATARDDAACYEMLVRKAGGMYGSNSMRKQKAESREQGNSGVHETGFRRQGSGFRKHPEIRHPRASRDP